MTQDISNSDDIIDSRDVIARIEELEDERAALVEAIDEASADTDSDAAKFTDANDALQDWDDSEGAELTRLRALAAEGSNYTSDWEHGATLIRDSYFETYAQELADDIGAINSDATWPNNCIDWERAARELQMDYSSISFDGVEYWVRS